MKTPVDKYQRMIDRAGLTDLIKISSNEDGTIRLVAGSNMVSSDLSIHQTEFAVQCLIYGAELRK